MAAKTQSDGDVSNSTIYNLLNQHVMPALQDIEGHLGRLNGTVAHLQERDKSHSRQLGELGKGQTGLSGRVAALEAVDDVEREYTQREVDDVKAHQIQQLNRIWEIGMKVAGTIAVLGFLVKLVMDFAK